MLAGMRAFVPSITAIALVLGSSSFALASEGMTDENGQSFAQPVAASDQAPSGYYLGQPPSYGYNGQPPSHTPPPPPPRRTGPEWNVRFNPFELLQGRASGAVEYAVTGPLSVGLAPTYVFGRPVTESGDGYDVGGWAIALQPAFWIDGSPFRGLALKLHLEHESVTYRIKTFDGSEEKKSLGLNKVGAMLATQSIHGGWFSFSGGIGIKKDLSYDEAEHTVTCPGETAGSNRCIVAAGMGRGFDVIGEIGIGVVF